MEKAAMADHRSMYSLLFPIKVFTPAYTTRPNHFIAANKLTSNSVISNLHIRNYPNRCFAIAGCTDLTIRSIVLDNSAGNPAAHNTDGFGVSSSTNVLITDSRVVNQDDCVAVTSGDRITVRNMQCVGSHGLSIGSIGGKADNRVTNVVFVDSTLTGAENGARIKSNYGTTGLVSNITFENLLFDGVTKKGIIVQQDYLNGGATGKPSMA
jgi:polygalacturonase